MLITRSVTRFGLPVVAALAMVGCGGDGPSETPYLPINPIGDPSRAGSIPTMTDPGFTDALARTLNGYRADAFGSGSFPLFPNDVLYTAALRHAGYLDSINSSEGGFGEPETNLDLRSDYTALSQELRVPEIPEVGAPVQGPIEPIWPTYYTDTGVKNRIQAVAGGRDLISGRNVFEDYMVLSGIQVDPETGNLTNFRSFSQDRVGIGGISDANNLWHHPFARMSLMRGSTKYIGVGTVQQARVEGSGDPPWPLFDGNFGAVALTVEETKPVIVTPEAYWPPDNGTTWTVGFDGPQEDPDDPESINPPKDPIFSGPIISVIANTSRPIQELEIQFARATDFGGLDDPSGSLTVSPNGDENTAANAYVYTNIGGIGTGDLAYGFGILNTGTLFYGYLGRGGTAGGGGDQETVLVEGGDILYIDQNANGDPGVPNGEDGLGFTLFDDVDPFPIYYPGQAVIRFAPSVDVSILQPGDSITIPPYDDPYLEGVDNSGANAGTFVIRGIDIRYNRVLVNQLVQDEIVNYFPNDRENITESPAIANISGFRNTDSTANRAAELRNGEVLIIPEDPLVDGAVYRIKVVARGTSADGIVFDKEWWFQARSP